MPMQTPALRPIEAYAALAELSALLGQGDEVENLLHQITARLRRWSGCEAVGVRLQCGADFPYFETRGFDEEFVRLENTLCCQGQSGGPGAIPGGKACGLDARACEAAKPPHPECMCGNVIQGRFDPALPFFTSRGSYFCNSTTALQAAQPETPQLTAHNRCNKAGYESVALVALRAGGRTFGLLQFNDRRPDRFTPEGVAFLECLADTVAMAMARKQALAALAESEGNYQALFAADNSVNLLLDPDTGVIVDANEAAARFYGYPLRQLIGMCISRINMLPLPKLSQALARAVNREQTRFSFRHRLAGGEIRDVESSVAAVRLRGKTHIISVVRDVTRRKQSEESLAQSEERFRKAIEYAPFPIMIHDEDGQVLTLSQAWTEITGYAREDLPTVTHWARRAYGEQNGQALKAIEQLFSLQTRASVGEYAVTCKDGSRRVWDFSSAPLGVVRGRKALISMAADVTLRKEMESALRAAKDAAEKSDHAKSEFLANMSHEIRTPLNGVLGMLQLLRQTTDDAERRQYEQMAYSSGKRLLDLLSDILDFSAMEHGSTTAQNAPLHLEASLDAVKALFQVACLKKNLALSVHQDSSVPEGLHGDDARIRQILFNLVGNAVKFTRQGTVFVEVWAAPEAGSASSAPTVGAGGAWRLHFAVQDTGVGIAPEKLDHIFDRFTQVDASYEREHQGAGLGLAIVKRIVSLLGGDISVTSEVGAGTRVEVALPVARPGAAAPTPPQEALPEPRQQIGPLSILVAEDDAINNLALRRLLQHMGHHVLGAATGQEVLEALSKAQFDCIFMDVQMPVMDGLAAARAIRTDPRFAAAKDVHIIAMTAYAMHGDKEKCLTGGMDDYVPKPAMLEDIANALQRARERFAARLAAAGKTKRATP